MQFNFHGKRVLVVEDNYLVASELALVLEAANAIVVGPCTSLADASLHLAQSDLAVLDISVRGQLSFDLADRLSLLEMPYVFFTGYAREHLPERFARVACITKPQPPTLAVQRLEECSREAGGQSVAEMIPVLRLHARSILSDTMAADRLVERTLQRALADPTPVPDGARIGPWLLRLMEEAMAEGHGQFMN